MQLSGGAPGAKITGGWLRVVFTVLKNPVPLLGCPVGSWDQWLGSMCYFTPIYSVF